MGTGSGSIRPRRRREWLAESCFVLVHPEGGKHDLASQHEGAPSRDGGPDRRRGPDVPGGGRATPAGARLEARPITCTPTATPPIQGSGLGDNAEGFLLDKGRFTRIAAPGAAPSTATTSINDRGQIVGARDLAPAIAAVRDRAPQPAQNSPYLRMTSNW